MDSCARAPDAPDPDAVAFVRFCRGRRRVAWPELYDEMWAVASRGLFRGWRIGELEGRGIEFGLFQMPSLAALVARVIEEEPKTAPVRRRTAIAVSPQRRGLAIVVDPYAEPVGADPAPAVAAASAVASADDAIPSPTVPSSGVAQAMIDLVAIG